MGMLRHYLIALCLLTMLRQCRSEGVFQLKLTSFVNDLGRDAEGHCCSGHRTPSGNCSSLCNTLFRVCLKHYQTTIDPNPPCTFGEVITPTVGNNTLDLVSRNLSGFVNPVQFPFDFQWMGTFSLIVEAWHKVDVNSGGSGRTLITRLATQRWLEVDSAWTHDVHRTNHTVMSYSFRVVCQENYYGKGCSTLCRPRNDSLGHFTCSPTGEKVCHAGWSDDYCRNAICLTGCTHGTCTKPNECDCRIGWQGRLCNMCKRYPGCHHGTCNNAWECTCDEGWGGLFCNQDLNYCTNHKPCKNGGTCTNTGQGSYTCTCPEGYTGTNCETDMDDCAHQPCYNGGNCVSLESNYTCVCPLGYFGERCETSASTCTENPCHNSGTCLPSRDGYQCICQSGFEGANCERQTDPCHPSPCLNGGSCVNQNDNFKCVCAAGFTGDRCESNINDCAHNPCLNGGTCLDEVNAFRCSCVPGFMGPLCQTNVKLCLAKPCANGGTCHDLVNDYSCSCKPGFTAKDCSVNIDDCRPNPCLNGGFCTDLVDEFSCQCLLGFGGSRCQLGGRGVSYGVQDYSVVYVTGASTEQSAVLQQEAAAEEEEEERLTPVQVAIVATLSAAVPFLAFVAVVIILVLRHRRRRRMVKQDEEVRKQNEQNAMNNKFIDNQIVNTLDRPMAKVTNSGAKDATLQRTSKTLNVDCSKLVIDDKVYSSQRTLDRTESGLVISSGSTLPPPPTSTLKSDKSIERDTTCSNIYVIEDHFPTQYGDGMLATEV